MGYSASLARQRNRRESSPEVSKLAQGAQTEKKLREVPQSECVTQSENSEEVNSVKSEKSGEVNSVKRSLQKLLQQLSISEFKIFSGK